MSLQNEVGVTLNNDFKEICELHASANALQFAAALTNLLIKCRAQIDLRRVLSQVKQHYDEHFHSCFDDQVRNIEESSMSRNNQNNLELHGGQSSENRSPGTDRQRARSQSEGIHVPVYGFLCLKCCIFVSPCVQLA